MGCDRPTAAPPAANAPAVARATGLGLPFREGTWLVFWGGDGKAVNRHVGGPNSQRRAADLDRIDGSGHMFSGDGKSNAQYFCFGSDVVAMADGKVVFAVDGVPDNVPGIEDSYFTSGNAVMIDHGVGFWAEYCHLKLRSVRVHEGDAVKRGDVIGQCGNSGATSQPHLHVQIQDGPRNETAWGVEGVFADVRVNRNGKDQTIAQYTFLKNDRIDASGATR
jgi:hypothetical protein